LVDLTEKTILIVDDQHYNLDALKIIISAVKKKDVSNLCQVAYNGKDAFEQVQLNAASFKYKRMSFKVIFMDCNMPVMDGYEATRKIRKFCDDHLLKQPMICAVTGHVEEEYI
jgi:CheY-like chemotaxis protein